MAIVLSSYNSILLKEGIMELKTKQKYLHRVDWLLNVSTVIRCALINSMHVGYLFELLLSSTDFSKLTLSKIIPETLSARQTVQIQIRSKFRSKLFAKVISIQPRWSITMK